MNSENPVLRHAVHLAEVVECWQVGRSLRVPLRNIGVCVSFFIFIAKNHRLVGHAEWVDVDRPPADRLRLRSSVWYYSLGKQRIPETARLLDHRSTHGIERRMLWLLQCR